MINIVKKQCYRKDLIQTRSKSYKMPVLHMKCEKKRKKNIGLTKSPKRRVDGDAYYVCG